MLRDCLYVMVAPQVMGMTHTFGADRARDDAMRDGPAVIGSTPMSPYTYALTVEALSPWDRGDGTYMWCDDVARIVRGTVMCGATTDDVHVADAAAAAVLSVLIARRTADERRKTLSIGAWVDPPRNMSCNP